MRQEKGFILNVVAIIVVLGIIYFSQQANFKSVGVGTQVIDWVKTNIYPRVSTEIQNRGGELTQVVNTQKNNLAQNAWDAIRNYLQKNFNYLFKTEVK
jgi:hypothetical protein